MQRAIEAPCNAFGKGARGAAAPPCCELGQTASMQQADEAASSESIIAFIILAIVIFSTKGSMGRRPILSGIDSHRFLLLGGNAAKAMRTVHLQFD